MRSKIFLTGACLLALGVSACETTDPYRSNGPRNNTATGAIAGAVGGALVGYLTNTSNSEQGRRNALIGAGVGALAGAGIGQYMDRQQRAMEEELSGTGVGVVRQGDVLVLRMPADITFGSNQDGVSRSAYAVLDDVARVLGEYDRSTIDVVGHADSDGADAYNLDLSQRRASNVARYLIDRGVLPARLYVEGRGESQPIADNGTSAGKAQNRRVEILIRPFTG